MAELGEVFISYSWDSEQHIESVLRLSNRLRSDGIDCVLDQYEISPPEGWPRWMDRKIAEASLVLVVCTETYLDRVMGREAQHKGLGVKWEGNLVYQHLYNAGDKNTKFVDPGQVFFHSGTIIFPDRAAVLSRKSEAESRARVFLF